MGASSFGGIPPPPYVLGKVSGMNTLTWTLAVKSSGDWGLGKVLIVKEKPRWPGGFPVCFCFYYMGWVGVVAPGVCCLFCGG